MKRLLDRIGRRGPIVMAISAVVIAMALQPFLGTDAWAGLGQWAGGLGAFFAAWAALRIANNDVKREEERDAVKREVQAYYVTGGWFKEVGKRAALKVLNTGTDPVLNVEIVALHLDGYKRPVIDLVIEGGPRRVLLPGDEFQPSWETNPRDLNDTAAALFHGYSGEVEITYEDLSGGRWRRFGHRPPVREG